ncbi:P-loop containing nucleoside triphosphate hydrolase protein, partial [Neoconidiobolus thromboides FSU 785]
MFFKKKNKKDEAESLPPVPILKLWKFATFNDWIILTFAFIFSIINGVSQPLIALLFSGIVGAFGNYAINSSNDPILAAETLKSTVTILCLQFLGVGIATLVAAYGQMSLWMVVGENQALRIRRNYYKAILSQEISWFDTVSSGDIASRISGDIHLVQDGISEKLGFMIQNFSTFLSGYIVAFTQGWKLSLVLMSVMPLVTLVAVLFTKVVALLSTGGQNAYGKASSVAEEVLSSIRTIYSFGSQRRETARYEKELFQARKDGHKRSIISGVSIGGIEFIVLLTYSLGMWYGSKLITEEGYKPENVISVFFSVVLGALSIGHSSPFLAALATAQGAAAKLFQVIERESKINPFICAESTKQRERKIKNFEGEIQFNNVVFSYPTRSNITTLNNLNLKVNIGTTVALVGPSGSGKSTTIGLIERFYDVSSGSITIDGTDIRDVSVEFLRNHIGIVGQEPILFSTSIKQNILFGLSNDEYNGKQKDGEIIQKRIEEACRLANIHDFIMTLPEGYETQVGEKGSLLSGGQKQRIAIARALIKNPKILLLDEATSALDSESEKIVQIALNNASRNRTTIVIAHRLSTIKDVDKILVFSNGKIEEEGTHEELLKEGGIYAGLVESQKIRTEEDQNEDQSYLINKELSKNKQKNKTMKETTVLTFDEKENEIIKIKSNKSILEGTKTGKQFSSLIRVLMMTTSWKRITLLGMIGSLCIGAIAPLYSLILGQISVSFIEIATVEFHEKGIADAKFYCLMFVALGAFTFITVSLKVGALEYVGESITYEIRLKAFKNLLNQEIAFYDNPDHGVGILCAKLSVEAQNVQQLVSKVSGPVLMAISSFSVGLGIAFYYGWKLTLVVLVCIPLAALMVFYEIKVLEDLNSNAKQSYEQVSQIATESIKNIRTVTGLSKEKVFLEDYENLVAKAHISTLISIYKASFGYSFAMGAPFIIYSLAFWYGSTLVINKEYDFAQMFQVVISVVFTGSALGNSSSQITTYVKAKIAAQDIFKLLDRKSTINCDEDYGTHPAKLTGNVKLTNARFSYPTRLDIPILQGLDVSILAGKRVALVGSSGSGKSTVISLIQRFYDLNSGSLHVEGTNIKEWNLPYLRSGMAIVGQEPVLFDLTIRENIAYGRPDASEEEIVNAAKMANAHNFILEQPEGYDTRVGERGGKLSGGQKQRIAIARAVLLNPKLLLLDEATSALDSDSEKVVQVALDKAAEGRTTITIAHRLSTVQD